MTSLKPVTTDEWANTIKAVHLVPGPTFGYQLTTGGVDLGLHLAFGEHLTDEARDAVAAALHELVGPAIRVAIGGCPEEAVRRETYTDGTSRRFVNETNQ